jgi:hypothetical protein
MPRRGISPGRQESSAYALLAAFSYPDYTVGPGVSPDLARTALAGCTADRELGISALTLPRRHVIDFNY